MVAAGTPLKSLTARFLADTIAIFNPASAAALACAAIAIFTDDL
ncbi:MAG: hypothetical protein PHX64_03245 [Candidatus Omnitrophica bacterium]|nr:hypothetical protein [Candidatus Omnitrophota bacterium]